MTPAPATTDPLTTRQKHRVRHNLGLVGRVLRHAREGDGRGVVDYDDLFQEGVKGLMRAAQKFDGSRKVRFSTYATFWIKQAIQRGCEKRFLVAIPAWVRRPTAGRSVGSKPEYVACAAVAARPVARLGFRGDGGGGAPYDAAEKPPEEDYWEEERAWLKKALLTLTEEERRVLKQRYDEGLTLAQIGAKVGRSKERVRQKVAEVVEKLRGMRP